MRDFVNFSFANKNKQTLRVKRIKNIQKSRNKNSQNNKFKHNLNIFFSSHNSIKTVRLFNDIYIYEMKMRAKFFRFQFIIEILYKLRNFGIRNYKENRKQKFQNRKIEISNSTKFKIKFHIKISPKNKPSKTYGILSLYI